MDEERLNNDEYEMQYYGFSSTEIYEDFKKEVSKVVKATLIGVRSGFMEEPNIQLTDEQLHDIYNIIVERAAVPLQKFKEESQKIFAIPKNIPLEENEYHAKQYSDEDIVQLKKEVAELEKVLIQEKVFLAKCKQLEEIMETVVKPTYEKVALMIKPLNNLLDQMNQQTETDEIRNKLLAVHNDLAEHYVGDKAKLSQFEKCFLKAHENFFE